MGDPSVQYARARKLVSAIEFQLQQLEERPRNQAAPSGPDEARNSLSENINLLHAEVASFERIVQQQFGVAATVANSKGSLWKKRLSQLQSEVFTLRRTVERYLRASYAGSTVAQEREQLLAGGSASQLVAVDAMLEERRSVTNSHMMLDELATLSGSVLAGLREQRGTLKSAHHKLLDIATSLGISNSLMRIIERRTTADKVLVYGIPLVLFALMLLIRYWWWRQ